VGRPQSTRNHGCCQNGWRLRKGLPHEQRQVTTNVVPAQAGFTVPIVLDMPIKSDWLEA
jgi:hypothetical protein